MQRRPAGLTQQGLGIRGIPQAAGPHPPLHPQLFPAAWRKQAGGQPTQLPPAAASPGKENEILFPMLLSSAEMGKLSKRS